MLLTPYISGLWLDEGFQIAYNRRNECQKHIHDSLAYYVENIQRLVLPDYVPTNEDVLWANLKTIGITETWLTCMQGIESPFLDVGGMRSEREKWIHTFPKTTVVMFTVDTTAYARLLFEDDTVNRMEEQLALFDSVVNNQWFSGSGFVLIFTKMDLLREWLWRYPVENYFPDYLQYKWLAIEPVEGYMQYLKGRFLKTVQSDETAARIGIVQGNLVRGSKDIVSNVLNAINSLATIYPDLNGLSRSESSAL
ncbi:G-protein alpha subunit-domain-containing protein [Xylaria digitata]|nr:G-protein alpha subunit-domain-containing protein [Xylaria digitata]